MKTSALLYPLLCACAPGLALTAALAAPSASPAANPEEGHALFALHCARCHGDGAAGSANGPPLRPVVRSMSEEAFAAKVLQRVHWKMSAAGAGSEDAARDAFVQGVLRLQEDDRSMPAWESEPAGE